MCQVKTLCNVVLLLNDIRIPSNQTGKDNQRMSKNKTITRNAETESTGRHVSLRVGE